MPTKDITENYRHFTKPAELHKAVNTLRGLVAGINSDLKVSTDEVTELVHWCEIHAELRDCHPFSEILPVIEHAMEDGVVTEDEAKDILWLCNNFVDSSTYYDVITSSIQFLSGLLHGLIADGALSDQEILTLKSWMDANSFLSGTYPFDEINSLLHVVLEDNKITQQERETLMALFGEVIDFTSSYNLSEKEFARLRKQYSLEGVCAVSPEILFQDKVFCFTGEFYGGKRAELSELVERLGGIVRNSVSAKTDYLVVGNAGNPCWAYACYGRKVEQAVNLCKQGTRVIIANETDFWDAVKSVSVQPEPPQQASVNDSDAFGCCSRYRDCSDAGCCLIPERNYSIHCTYRKKLEDGVVFYGKMGSDFSMERYQELLSAIHALPAPTRRTLDNLVIEVCEYHRAATRAVVRSEYLDGLPELNLFDFSLLESSYLKKCKFRRLSDLVLEHPHYGPLFRRAQEDGKGKQPGPRTKDFLLQWLSHDGILFRDELFSPYRVAYVRMDSLAYLEAYYMDELASSQESRIYPRSPFAENGLLTATDFKAEEQYRIAMSSGYSAEEKERLAAALLKE